MIIIKHPSGYMEERNYIFKTIFEEFLGLSFKSQKISGDQVQISLKDDLSQRVLVFPDILFQTNLDKWLTLESMPKEPLLIWDIAKSLPEVRLTNSEIPILYGKPFNNEMWFKQNENVIRLGLDIFGSIFFMLTRYEELVLSDRDEHERFPARASLLYRNRFLERPLVNEYLEILWNCMKRLWPGLERKNRVYKVLLSHDVDHPFISYDQKWTQIFRNIAGDLIRRKDMNLAFQRINCRIRSSPKLDPANTFDFIMDLSERYGIRSEFYFMTDHTAGPLDGSKYSIESPEIKYLMRRIYERGHKIGFHASYNSFCDFKRIKDEFEKLITIAEELGIKQDSWGGRQHYLRFKNPITWQNWEDAGLNYDSTVGFADHIGFRCGTCYEFPVFNLKTKKMLNLIEFPLIVMEGTLWGSNYMNLKLDEIIERVISLSKICRNYEGIFTLLWHNTSLLEKSQKKIYLEIIDDII